MGAATARAIMSAPALHRLKRNRGNVRLALETGKVSVVMRDAPKMRNGRPLKEGVRNQQFYMWSLASACRPFVKVNLVDKFRCGLASRGNVFHAQLISFEVTPGFNKV